MLDPVPNTLEERMARLGVKEEDIEESFIRSSGPGGQNVNKTSTCVYLKHLPTGIEVKCQMERSQAMNRIFARNILLNKIEARKREENLKRQSQKARDIRLSRKKPRRIKEKILEKKRKHSQKKSLRRKVYEI